MWKKIIKLRYGDCEHQILSNNCCNCKVPSSTWWKDVTKLATLATNLGFNFAGSVFYKIGDESQTHFRSSNWCGNTPLAYLFLDLFALNNVKGAFVIKMGSCCNVFWCWGDVGFSIRILTRQGADCISCMIFFSTYCSYCMHIGCNSFGKG